MLPTLILAAFTKVSEGQTVRGLKVNPEGVSFYEWHKGSCHGDVEIIGNIYNARTKKTCKRVCEDMGFGAAIFNPDRINLRNNKPAPCGCMKSFESGRIIPIKSNIECMLFDPNSVEQQLVQDMDFSELLDKCEVQDKDIEPSGDKCDDVNLTLSDCKVAYGAIKKTKSCESDYVSSIECAQNKNKCEEQFTGECKAECLKIVQSNKKIVDDEEDKVLCDKDHFTDACGADDNFEVCALELCDTDEQYGWDDCPVTCTGLFNAIRNGEKFQFPEETAKTKVTAKMNKIASLVNNGTQADLDEYKKDWEVEANKDEFKSGLKKLKMYKVNQHLVALNKYPGSTDNNAETNPLKYLVNKAILTPEEEEDLNEATFKVTGKKMNPKLLKELRVADRRQLGLREDVSPVLTYARAGSNFLAESGLDAFGDVSAVLALADPALDFIDPESTPQGKVRSLIQFKLQVLAQVSGDLGPVGTLFSFGSNLVTNINDSNACRGKKNGGAADCNIEELLPELPRIALTSVLDTIGNGFLSDMYTVFQVAEKIGRKEALDATDFITLTGVGIRLGCSVLTLAIPVASVGCGVASALTTLALEAPIVQDIVVNIGTAVVNNPLVKAVVPALGNAIHTIGRTTEKILRPAKKVFDTGVKVLAKGFGALASGFAGLFGRKPVKRRGNSYRAAYRGARKQRRRRR